MFTTAKRSSSTLSMAILGIHNLSVRCFGFHTTGTISSLSTAPMIHNIRRSVHLGGTGRASLTPRAASSRLSPSAYTAGERPPDPLSLISQSHLDRSVHTLSEWFTNKNNVLTLTGAGLSTDSGIPDYRGHRGSYHEGHKPISHAQFMTNVETRKRYWGRGMIGWRDFANSSPNEGHMALTKLERIRKIGVDFEDDAAYYDPESEDAAMHWAFGNGAQRMSIVTQNVDFLHRKAGTESITELHGRNDRVKCMKCGAYHSRYEFHDELEDLNRDWMEEVTRSIRLEEKQFEENKKDGNSERRPDGDANLSRESYSDIIVPPCPYCGDGFMKPDVVFFGDTVPKHRVERCYGAVKASDGLLCIGTSLAVLSAYRFVQAAAKDGIPIAILNVGGTRAEESNLDVLKIEAPAGPVLSALACSFGDDG